MERSESERWRGRERMCEKGRVGETHEEPQRRVKTDLKRGGGRKRKKSRTVLL